MRRMPRWIAVSGLVLLAAGGMLGWRAEPVARADASGEQEVPGEETDPLGANAACYVCHMTFVKEDLARVHLKAKVPCTKCHGLSDKHANDEHIGATKPDITYRRDQIDASCTKCHEKHDAAAKKVIARFVERKLSGTPTCTGCHGTHKIERPAEER